LLLGGYLTSLPVLDFGFIFDIAPGGIKFESAPFKLTTEMVSIMGGNPTAEPYQWFAELCVRCFLACRRYATELLQMVELMIPSELPCFKGRPTSDLLLRQVFSS
jgi:phosphatidylinositol 4-kinase